MKTLVLVTLAIVVASALARLALLVDAFAPKAAGAALLVLGLLLVFALGDTLSEMDGSAMEIGGAFIISGAVLILFV